MRHPTCTMESILASFHLDIRTFSELLKATGGVVAGSAAAAAYVTGTPYTFTPNDIDIWVPNMHSDAYEFLFAYFLRQHGYVEVHQPQSEEYTSNPVFAILRRIQRFQHATGRVVQVMYCMADFARVLDTFDLSVAATWWVPSGEHGILNTVNDHVLMEGCMYSLRPPTEREMARIEKYAARGFTLV